jgi:CSLREA domain-containing protein
MTPPFRSLFAAAFLLLAATPLFAATFVVTKTADTNGTCNSGVDCSLREAIKAANDEVNHPGADTIVFAGGVTGTISLTTVLPNITSGVSIQGPGSGSLELTRTGGVFRIFFLTNGTSSGPTVTISGLSITNGHATGAQFPATNGGGIFNDQGTLTVNNCTLSGNTADFGGAAIFNTGILTLSNCVVSSNTAADEGAIENDGGSMAVTSCTFSGYVMFDDVILQKVDDNG